MSKARPRTSRLLVVFAVGMGACGGGGKGSGSYPDASTFGSGGNGGNGAVAGSGSGNTVGTATGGAGAGKATGGSGIVFPGSGGSGTAAGGSTGTVTVPPAAGSTVVLQGTAVLLRPGVPCSHAPATTTPAPDVWCGALVVSSGQNIGLVAIDVTKALAGATITCAATDTNCVALNATIDTSASHGFFGQTLIYYDASKVYAWRPGWTAGRALIATSSSAPAQCIGNVEDAPTAMCVSSAGVAYAGTLDAQTGTTLPMVDTLGATSTGIAFAPGGKSVIWSTNTSTTSPAETLKMQTIGDATTKKTVASSVTSWTVSADATRWYWLSAPTTDSNKITSGTLQTAAYPAGTTPASIQTKVSQFMTFGAKSVATLTTASATSATGADLNVVTDVDSPTTTTALVEGMDVVGLVSVNDGGTILYATTAQQPDPSSNNILVDLHTINADGTGKCVVAATAVADPGASFNGTNTAVEWLQVTLDSSANVTAVAGQFTTLADCAPHPFSTTLYGFYDESTALVVQQNLDSTAATNDIVYIPFAATGLPGAPALVQAGADVVIEPLFPSPGRILYALVSGAATDGIYASPVLPAATPYTAPTVRPLASKSLAARLTAAPRQSARTRLTLGPPAGIPNLIAAPTRALSSIGHALKTHLLRPSSRTAP